MLTRKGPLLPFSLPKTSHRYKSMGQTFPATTSSDDYDGSSEGFVGHLARGPVTKTTRGCPLSYTHRLTPLRGKPSARFSRHHGQPQTVEASMFPGMSYCILTTDPDFAHDMSALLLSQQAEVFVASSFREYETLQAEGVVVEMVIVDPVFRIC